MVKTFPISKFLVGYGLLVFDLTLNDWFTKIELQEKLFDKTWWKYKLNINVWKFIYHLFLALPIEYVEWKMLPYFCQNVNVVFDCPVAGAPTPIMERDEVKESLKTSIGKVS